MTAPAPTPFQVWQVALDERDDAIRAEHRAGASVADLAERWSLSRVWVAQIVWRGGRSA